MKKLSFSLGVLLLCMASLTNAQTIAGKLLVVGGGSERYNGWSDLPYAWAVEQAANKRVAIIGTESSPTDWLPTYFIDRGAVFAKNFPIPTTAVANQQATYDSLLTYDLIFFRGGNQWNYYNRYRNTLLHQAVEEVFLSGGVIGGTSAGLHILSEVLFTAQNGTVYPDEALANPFNHYMTLADDFLPFMPNMIFDSHFVERARFGRLLGFLGNWKLAQDEDIVGIGIDDRTALCIDSDMMGYVYGTGAVSMYKAAPDNVFSQGGTKLLATNIEVMHLLHECTINLNTFEYTGMDQQLVPEMEGEIVQGNLWLSGSDILTRNHAMLQQLIAHTGPNDTILLITGSSATANSFANYLNQQGANTHVMGVTAGNGENDSWKTRIENAKTFLFVANVYNLLMDFFENTTNGQLLHDLVLTGEKNAAFVGNNSRFAGKTVVVNYEQAYASFDGLLELGNGAAFLANTVVMPNTFAQTIDVENAATGVPYVMVHDSLRFGMWLFDDCFARYSNTGNSITLTSFGSFPMVFIENTGTTSGLGTQSAVSSGRLRQVAGFGNFNLSLMDESMQKQISMVSGLKTLDVVNQWKLYPNPASDYFEIHWEDQHTFDLSLFDLTGRLLLQKTVRNTERISTSMLEKGIYILRLHNSKGEISGTKKLIVQ